MSPLTNRQLEFLSLSAQGMRYSQIAAICFVQPDTVTKALDGARERLGARTLPQAVAIAITMDLLVLGANGIASAPNEVAAA